MKIFPSLLNYMLLFSEVQRASTLPPTEVMAAMAATTIRPTIRAYSRTSPPVSSERRFLQARIKDRIGHFPFKLWLRRRPQSRTTRHTESANVADTIEPTPFI